MQKSLGWIRHNSEFLILVLVLFAIGIAVGLHTQIPDQIISKQLDKLKEIRGIYQSHGSHDWLLSILILFNNLLFSALVFISGTFLAVFPIMFILTNGMLIGYVVFHASADHGISIWKIVALGMLPHGIFEIPAILIATAMGLKLGSVWIRPLHGKSRFRSYGIIWTEALRVAPFVGILLIVAAVVEGFVTPILLHAAY